MMGQQAGLQERLFYEFRVDDWVPADHLLRKIDGILNFCAPAWTAPCAHEPGRRVRQGKPEL